MRHTEVLARKCLFGVRSVGEMDLGRFLLHQDLQSFPDYGLTLPVIIVKGNRI